MWCISKITPEFEIKMMDVLEQYEQPYDSKQPRINFDEKLYQLLATPRGSKPVKPAVSKREDYEYKRISTANHFVCVEPKAGKRYIRVTNRRTKKDFAKFIRFLVMKAYAKAKKIHITLDNLNTHNNSSIIEQYGEKEGQLICSRIKWHYTPSHASWLNAAEIEIGVLTSNVLKNRIGEKSELKKHIKAYQIRRNKAEAKINWQFNRENARDTFRLHQN